VRDPFRVLPPQVEQVPPGFGGKYSRFESTVAPNFTGMPSFGGFDGMGGGDWSTGYDQTMRVDERSFRGRRGGPGGPMRRSLDGGRDHPYERREGWTERRDDTGFTIDRTRVRETRQLRSYRDLDAPQEATPELNY
jgi:hypothetical protein